MFRDKVAGTRVQTTSEEAGHEEVDQRIDANKSAKSIVENELNEDVDSVPSSRRLGPHETWAECVKQNLEGTVGDR